jgi:hypothetical protein
MAEIRKTEEGFTDLKSDYKGNVIPGGSKIVGIINQTILPVLWEAVTMPSDIAAKQMIINERDANDWRLSMDQSDYYTVTGPLAIEIGVAKDQVLFYAQTTTASGSSPGVIEVLLVD